MVLGVDGFFVVEVYDTRGKHEVGATRKRSASPGPVTFLAGVQYGSLVGTKTIEAREAGALEDNDMTAADIQLWRIRKTHRG